jgi:hypothetical protein
MEHCAALSKDITHSFINCSASAFDDHKEKRPHANNRSLEHTLLEIHACYKTTEYWDKLAPTERIIVEGRWTDLMLELLAVGNRRVMHSLHYGLREKTPEEDVDEMLQLDDTTVDNDNGLSDCYYKYTCLFSSRSNNPQNK